MMTTALTGTSQIEVFLGLFLARPNVQHCWPFVTTNLAAILEHRYMRNVMDEYELSARNLVEAAGGQFFTDVNKPSFSDALVSAYSKFPTEPKAQNLLKRVQDYETARR